MALFYDRQDAGRQLATKLSHYQHQDVVVYALPRGGLPIANEIAHYLSAPLELIITRKIGHPFNSEYAIGAISENGKAIYNPSEIMKVDDDWLMYEEAKLQNEIKRRRLKYKKQDDYPSLIGKTAILVDDGIATGYTMLAAIDDIKKKNPKAIVVAIPVIPEFMAQKLEQAIQEVVTVERTRHYLGAVSAYYEQFKQLSDDDVITSLQFRASTTNS